MILVNFKKILAAILAVAISIGAIVAFASQEDGLEEGYVFDMGYDEFTVVEGMLDEEAIEDGAIYIQEFADFAEMYNDNVTNYGVSLLDETASSEPASSMTPQFVEWNWETSIYQQTITDAAAFMPGYTFKALNPYLWVDISVAECEDTPVLGVYKFNSDNTLEYVSSYALEAVAGSEGDYEFDNSIRATPNSQYVFMLAASKNWTVTSMRISFTEIVDSWE